MNSKYIYTNGMDSISLVSYYQVLRQRVQRIVSYLKDTIRVFDEMDVSLLNYYNLDDCNVDSVNINDIYKTLSDRVSYLSNTVIPAIDTKIRSIKADTSGF